MKCVSVLAALIAGAMVLCTCGVTPSPEPVNKSVDLSASFKIDPDPPVPMKETLLELALHDAEGRPISGATVHLDLTMPGMEMPPNQPQMTDVGNGLYRAQAIFTMAGEWQIAVDVQHSQGIEHLTFQVRTK